VPPPGVQVEPRRFVPRLHYELLVCGTRGHEIVGSDAAGVREQDALVVRQKCEEERWHRCLRCDSWVVLEAPDRPVREHPPERDEIDLPLRGRPLRDKIVLRAIAIDRAFHFFVLGLLALLLLLVASNEQQLRDAFYKVVTDLQTSLGGTARPVRGGFVGRIEELLGSSQGTLHAAAAALGAYAVLEGVEAVGLWYQRRWAEYLTFVATTALLPLEVYELTQRATVFKVIALVVNVAVVVYLLLAKRLFGLRGGAAADEAARAADMGWPALERARPHCT
jgi:hypothetical protein